MTKVVFITSSGAWALPADFSSLVSIEGIGGGAGGRPGYINAFFQQAAAPGGGGGAYAKITALSGLSANATVYVQVGAGGGSNAAGGDTWFNKTSNAAPTSTADGILAKAGSAPASNTAGGLGGSATASIGDTKFAGGNGGNVTGALTTGGGGAAGPNAAGGNAKGTNNFEGGNGNGGQTGGGTGGTTYSATGGVGSYWTQTSNNATAGPGGGAAGRNTVGQGSAGGSYGGAGSGGGGLNNAGGSGQPGIIVFTYNEVTTDATLSATEAADTASLSLSAFTTAAVEATEAADTADIRLTDANIVVLQVTEPPDLAIFTIPFEIAALEATEAHDALAFSGTVRGWSPVNPSTNDVWSDQSAAAPNWSPDGATASDWTPLNPT